MDQEVRNPKCILVVDDDRDQQAILRVLLDHCGYESRHAATIGDARAVLASERVDLVVLDIRLHGEHGLDLLYAMHFEGPPVPILVCTSDAFAQYRYRKAKEAAAGWLVKPINFGELMRCVQRIIGPGCT